MLKKRITLSLISIFSLITGLAIYLLLRKDTYLHGYFSVEFCNSVYINAESNILTDFIRYYLTDFLWAFAFGAALTAVSYSHKRNVIVLNSASSFLVGVIFELLQLCCVINGTFDFIDILMYAVAALTCAAINIKLFKGVNQK